MRRRIRYRFPVAVALLILFAGGCQHTPPNLSPAGVTAFQNIQATKTLDLVRDLAIDASHTGVITRAQALPIVNWHTAAIKTLDARTQGWQATITTGLDQAVLQFDAATKAKFAPYVALVKTVIASL